MKFFWIISLFIFSTFYNISGQDYSVNFDGQNDYVRISDHSDLDLTQNYTLEAWIFPESFSWLAGIISKYQTNAANGYMLRLTFQSPYTGLGFDEVVTSTGVLSANQWYHIAAVNDEGIRKIFINGIEFELTGSPLNVVANNNSIRIGSDYGGRYFDGRIDEVRIWNIAREQEEISETMDTILTGQEAGLIAYYSFNEGAGDTLFDQTSNGHNGIIIGNPAWVDGYTLSGVLGDINFDEVLNIYDAVMLVAIMLTHEDGTELQLNACDTNQDGIIDIEDIVLLFEWILGINSNEREILSSGTYSITNNLVTINSDGEIAGFQFLLSNPSAIENIQLPQGWNWNQSGSKCIAYSIDGTPLPKDFSFSLNNSVVIEKVKLVGWGRKVVQAKENQLPKSFNLIAFPNPFNNHCTISFEIYKTSNIKLGLYNINGQYLETIGEVLIHAGYHKLNWRPKDLASGVYFISISDVVGIQLQKILYLK